MFLLKEKSSTHYVAIIHIEKRLDTIVNYLRQFVTKIVVLVSLKTILRVGHYLQTQTSIELKFWTLFFYMCKMNIHHFHF